MKIIQPKVELWRQGEDVKAHVARCARVCYKRKTGNNKALYKGLINSHHWSMFRHETVYAMVPTSAWNMVCATHLRSTRVVLAFSPATTSKKLPTLAFL